MSHIKPTRDNDPKWLAGLKQYKDADEPKRSVADVRATLRNHGGDARATKQATYDREHK